jgi:replicative superfamily II helicase
MARFDERSGQLYVTELGRVASHFYIRHKSIVAFNELLKPHMTESEVRMLAACHCSPSTCCLYEPLVSYNMLNGIFRLSGLQNGQ